MENMLEKLANFSHFSEFVQQESEEANSRLVHGNFIPMGNAP